MGLLKKHLLSCKDATHAASNYLDGDVTRKLNWKIRFHLLACKCCRRFIRHLTITRKIVPHIIRHTAPIMDAETLLQNIKKEIKTTQN